jgi:hypothetical protein
MAGSTAGRHTCGRQMSWFWFFMAVALAIILLWPGHRGHVLGILPYLILFACPLVHLFMHRGHRHGGSRAKDRHA